MRMSLPWKQLSTKHRTAKTAQSFFTCKESYPSGVDVGSLHVLFQFYSTPNSEFPAGVRKKAGGYFGKGMFLRERFGSARSEPLHDLFPDQSPNESQSMLNSSQFRVGLAAVIRIQDPSVPALCGESFHFVSLPRPFSSPSEDFSHFLKTLRHLG